MPVCNLLVGVCQTEEGRFASLAAGDLHINRQLRGKESAEHGDRGQPGACLIQRGSGCDGDNGLRERENISHAQALYLTASDRVLDRYRLLSVVILGIGAQTPSRLGATQMKYILLFSFVSFFVASAASAENTFDAVFEIMSRPRSADSTGCAGCHIGAEPVPGIPYFGMTQDEVENYLKTDDDGDHVEGGRCSPLARRLRQEGEPPAMPMFGAAWSQDELDTLYTWFDSFVETPAGADLPFVESAKGQ